VIYEKTNSGSKARNRAVQVGETRGGGDEERENKGFGRKDSKNEYKIGDADTVDGPIEVCAHQKSGAA